MFFFKINGAVRLLCWGPGWKNKDLRMGIWNGIWVLFKKLRMYFQINLGSRGFLKFSGD